MKGNKCRICGRELESYDENKRGLCKRCSLIVEILGKPENSPDILEVWLKKKLSEKPEVIKSGVVCVICRKTFPCDKKEIVEDCAKKHGLYKIKITDLKNGTEESMYICRNCYEDFLESENFVVSSQPWNSKNFPENEESR